MHRQTGVSVFVLSVKYRIGNFIGFNWNKYPHTHHHTEFDCDQMNLVEMRFGIQDDWFNNTKMTFTKCVHFSFRFLEK